MILISSTDQRVSHVRVLSSHRTPFIARYLHLYLREIRRVVSVRMKSEVKKGGMRITDGAEENDH